MHKNSSMGDILMKCGFYVILIIIWYFYKLWYLKHQNFIKIYLTRLALPGPMLISLNWLQNCMVICFRRNLILVHMLTVSEQNRDETLRFLLFLSKFSRFFHKIYFYPSEFFEVFVGDCYLIYWDALKRLFWMYF